MFSVKVRVKRGKEILQSLRCSYFTPVPWLAGSNKVPVSKLPEINRRRENCSALDGFPFPGIQPDLLLSRLERPLDYSETRVISQSRATSNKEATSQTLLQSRCIEMRHKIRLIITQFCFDAINLRLFRIRKQRYPQTNVAI